MKTIRIGGIVHEDHQLSAVVPPSLPPGPVDVMVVVPPGTELQRSVDWMSQVAHQWKAELNQTEEDIYNYSDGEPVDGTRWIYLANFHFGETTGVKLRPVLLLTRPIGPVPEVIVAYITSIPPEFPLASDLVLHPSQPEGLGTNLKTTSAIRLHKITTVHAWSLLRYLGKLPPETLEDVGARMRTLFGPSPLNLPSEA